MHELKEFGRARSPAAAWGRERVGERVGRDRGQRVGGVSRDRGG